MKNEATLPPGRAEAEHLLSGSWKSNLMALHFSRSGNKGIVRVSGPQHQPDWLMDFTLHQQDDAWLLKLQDNNRNSIENNHTTI